MDTLPKKQEWRFYPSHPAPTHVNVILHSSMFINLPSLCRPVLCVSTPILVCVCHPSLGKAATSAASHNLGQDIVGFWHQPDVDQMWLYITDVLVTNGFVTNSSQSFFIGLISTKLVCILFLLDILLTKC